MASEMTERANGSKRVSTVFKGESKTEQSHRDKCNINSIVARFHKTGQLPPATATPHYGDFTQVGDYHSCCEAVRLADLAFMSLPAKVRAAFRNDPGLLIAFLEDPGNRDEAIRLGLIAPAAAEPIVAQAEPQDAETPLEAVS